MPKFADREKYKWEVSSHTIMNVVVAIGTCGVHVVVAIGTCGVHFCALPHNFIRIQGLV